MARKAQASAQVQTNDTTVAAKPSKAERALAKQLAVLQAQHAALVLEQQAAAKAKVEAEVQAAEDKAKVDAVVAKGKTGLLYALAAGIGAVTVLVAR